MQELDDFYLTSRGSEVTWWSTAVVHENHDYWQSLNRNFYAVMPLAHLLHQGTHLHLSPSIQGMSSKPVRSTACKAACIDETVQTGVNLSAFPC